MLSNRKKAIKEALKPELIMQTAKLQGIYEGTESLDVFCKGYSAAVYAVANRLGLTDADITQAFENS